MIRCGSVVITGKQHIRRRCPRIRLNIDIALWEKREDMLRQDMNPERIATEQF